MCPACGNYFYESSVRSYSVFGAIIYSDGTVRKQGYHTPFWLTRCPACTQYFAKDHLFSLPAPVSPDLYFGHAKHSHSFLKNPTNFGHFDSAFGEEESKMEFIEKAIEKGLYFPVTVGEKEKEKFRISLYKDLWHEYNMHREKRSNETYKKLCSDLIAIIESQTEILLNTNKLILAELYRNIGDFEKCLAILDEFKIPDTADKLIERIRAEAIKNNTLTVIIEDTTK
jgi:hypothetical protein